MKRIQAISKILEGLHEDTMVIFSNGMVSCDGFQYDRDRTLYMVGAMGSAVGVGIGLALARPDCNICVISGDGAFAMDYAITLLEWPRNLQVHVLVNHCHATTGGQPNAYKGPNIVVGIPKWHEWYVDGDKGTSPRVGISIKDNIKRFMNAISK